MSSLDYLDLCRLCLVKDRVSVPIFEGEGDVRQIFLKIAACLPVKVGREDKLPKKICDDCVYKVELFYQFWNTTANAEKQLLQWLGEVSLDDKQGYVTGPHPSLMKPGQNPGENRLDGSVMQQVNDHPNNMGMGMLDSMGMGMPMMISTSGQQQQPQQQMTSVPMDTGGVQTVQAVPGPSTQSSHDQITQQKASGNQEDDEDESEEDENSDDECDGDDGLPVKEESEEDPNSSRTIEPTTFVNVSLACDEAGPSGLQQQKIGEMPEMVMPPTDGDPKSGKLCRDSRPFVPDRRSVRMQRTPRLEDIVTEDGITYTTMKKGSVTVDGAEIEPFYNVVVKTEDDELLTIKTEEDGSQVIKKEEDSLLTEGGEELVHLNDDIDEEEVYGDYSCQKCNICFPTWNLLKSHMKSVHEAIQCFKCKICFKVYNNLEPFAQHVSAEHAADSFTTDDCLETLTLYRVSRGTSLYTHNKRKYSTRTSSMTCQPPSELLSCSHCDYKTKIKSELAVHVAKHVGDVKFSCKTCGRKFKVRRNLTYHVRFSHREHSSICDVCGKTFANSRTLHTHRKFVHFKGKYECKLCSRLLISQENLDTHMQRQHVDKKPVKDIVKPKPENAVCEACGKVFTKSDKLKMHMRVHTGERPYVCAICKESFARKNSLRQHLILHTGTKPYVCDICGKAFAQKPGLTGHRRSHPGPHPPLPPVFIGPILDDVLRRCEQ